MTDRFQNSPDACAPRVVDRLIALPRAVRLLASQTCLEAAPRLPERTRRAILISSPPLLAVALLERQSRRAKSSPTARLGPIAPSQSTAVCSSTSETSPSSLFLAR